MPCVFIPDSHLDPVKSLEKINAKANLTPKKITDFDFNLFNWQHNF
jgi:hypothetical protein